MGPGRSLGGAVEVDVTVVACFVRAACFLMIRRSVFFFSRTRRSECLRGVPDCWIHRGRPGKSARLRRTRFIRRHVARQCHCRRRQPGRQIGGSQAGGSEQDVGEGLFIAGRFSKVLERPRRPGRVVEIVSSVHYLFDDARHDELSAVITTWDSVPAQLAKVSVIRADGLDPHVEGQVAGIFQAHWRTR